MQIFSFLSVVTATHAHTNIILNDLDHQEQSIFCISQDHDGKDDDGLSRKAEDDLFVTPVQSGAVTERTRSQVLYTLSGTRDKLCEPTLFQYSWCSLF